MKPLRIALIAQEPPEPGPATTGDTLAIRIGAMLAEAGHDVEICFAGGGAKGAMSHRKALHRLGIRVSCLYLPATSDLRASLAVMCWLKSAAPNLAVFAGAPELAYFPTLARTTRTGLLDTALAALVLDSAAERVTRDGRFVAGPQDILRRHVSVEAAVALDLIVTLSPDARSWADGSLAGITAGRRLDLPCPPLAVQSLDRCALAATGGTQRLRRLALCGELSLSGGIEHTVKLIHELSCGWPAELAREVAFVGRWGSLPNGESGAIVASRIAIAAGIACRFYDPDAYILDVQAGRVDDDFAVLIESGAQCFDVLAALLATRALDLALDDNAYAGLFGGDAASFLVADDVPKLAAACRKLGRRDGPASLAAAVNLQAASRRSAEELLRALADAAAEPPLDPFQRSRDPRVSVCMSHFDRPELLEQAVRSLEAQDYPNVEIVIVDDASPGPAAKAAIDRLERKAKAHGWIVLRNETEQWQQESRNIAARNATGDYVLIMDDDNCARPDEISTMVTVAESLNRPIVRCLQANFEGTGYPAQDADETRVDFFPTGGPLSVGTMWNVFGDVNVLYRRETFLGLGGFGRTDGLGCEDFEIGIRAAQAGIDAITIPRVLYDYRMSAFNLAKSMSNKRLYDSHARLSSLYEERVHPCLAPVFRLLNQNFHRGWQRDGHAYWTRPMPAPGSFRGRVQAAHPLEAEALFYLAGLLAEAGALADAETLAASVHRQFPNNRRVGALLSRILLMRGKTAELRRQRDATGEASAEALLAGIDAFDASATWTG